MRRNRMRFKTVYSSGQWLFGTLRLIQKIVSENLERSSKTARYHTAHWTAIFKRSFWACGELCDTVRSVWPTQKQIDELSRRFYLFPICWTLHQVATLLFKWSTLDSIWNLSLRFPLNVSEMLTPPTIIMIAISQTIVSFVLCVFSRHKTPD